MIAAAAAAVGERRRAVWRSLLPHIGRNCAPAPGQCTSAKCTSAKCITFHCITDISVGLQYTEVICSVHGVL